MIKSFSPKPKLGFIHFYKINSCEVLFFSSLLPPKKLLGSKEPAFIMKRRRELEAYLQVVIFIPCFQVARWTNWMFYKIHVSSDLISWKLLAIFSFTCRLFAISWRGTFHRTWPPFLILARCSLISFSFYALSCWDVNFCQFKPKAKCLYNAL